MESNPLSYVPRMIFFTKGKGIHKDYLTSFELALRDASIEDLNLVFVSSIKPPQCKIVNKDEGRKHLQPGQITFTVMARSATNEPNRLIAASIGLARPADDTRYGYLSEQPGRQLRGPEIMQRTWPWRCWQQLWACQTTLHLPGIREKNSGDFRERFTKHRILHNLHKVTKMDSGPRF